MKTLTAAVLIISIGLVVMSTGCASHVLTLEKDIALFMKDDALSVDCKAGIAAAAILAPDTTADVRIAAEGVQRYANKDSDDYKRCYTKTAFFSFAIRGGTDEINRIAVQIGTMGVVK